LAKPSTGYAPSNPEDRSGSASASASAPRSSTDPARSGQPATGNGSASPKIGTAGAAGASNGAGARPAGNNPATSLGGIGSGLRPSYSPYGSRDAQTRGKLLIYIQVARGYD
jgi:hypothetical protein